MPPSPGFAQLTASLTKSLKAGHVNMASLNALTYNLNLTTLPTQAAILAEKLKSSGATTVVFAGDPIMPIYLTRASANIGYYPEWIITGIALTDTSTLARYYDQAEWAHAFGVTSLAVPVPVTAGDAYRLYRWWYGPRATPASLAVSALVPPIQQFFEGVQLAGADLTPGTFTTGLFRAATGRWRAHHVPGGLWRPGRATAAQLFLPRRLHLRLVRRHGKRPRRGGRQRDGAHALRQRWHALQGRGRAVRTGPDVLSARLGDELLLAPRRRAVLSALARVTGRANRLTHRAFLSVLGAGRQRGTWPVRPARGG